MKKISTLLILFLLYSSITHADNTSKIPNRIISLAPNLTEILFKIGLGSRIVGVSSFCDYPKEVNKIPKVGGMVNPSLEAILKLKPDIVIITTDGNQKDFEKKLRSLKIKTYIFKARRLSELPEEIRKMGKALGVKGKAEVVAKYIEESIDNIKNSRIKIQNSKKTIFIIWPEPLIVAGPGTAIDDAIKLLGYRNIASSAKIPYPKYSIEEIIRKSPDIIFIGRGHKNIKKISEKLIKRIYMTPAVKNGNIFFLSDKLYRLSPRIIEGIKEMEECLRSKSLY